MIWSVVIIYNESNRMETIGNGLKSLFSRLQNIKVGKYLSDEGEALNDTEKVLNSLGVSLRTSATEWREPMEVLNEVGEMWDSFNCRGIIA